MQAYLRVQISITLSTSGLNTKRTLKNSWFLFIGGILGSVVGLLGAFGVLMFGVERISEKYCETIKKGKKIHELIENTQVISTNFSKCACFGKRNPNFMETSLSSY